MKTKTKDKVLSSRAVRKLDKLELTVAERSIVEKLLVAPMYGPGEARTDRAAEQDHLGF